MRILVTGGAGFIGSHLVDALVARAHEVTVFDNLDPQVHGDNSKPKSLNSHARFVKGDIRNYESLKKCLLDGRIEVVFHEAAAVGVGQSMYEVRRYVEVNSLGAANLLDIVANNKNCVQKLIVASSMSIYGEGKYRCVTHGVLFPRVRADGQLLNKDYELKCSDCGRELEPLPTDENKPLLPTSIYATTKRDHEEMFIEFGEAYKIPAVALRYFNVYGPGQALSNPYTGVVSIFASRLLNGNAPLIFEDGLQSRDFVHVSDIVQANVLALEKEEANYEVFNIGSGHKVTILEIAKTLNEKLNTSIEPIVLEKFRAGDVRHCFADISKVRTIGYTPKVAFGEGMVELASFLQNQQPQDGVNKAVYELEKRGLTK
jgi:dTDP-L-rhamnose 4-epimerase